jgi:hypothetical protein
MENRSTFFLRAAIYVIGLIVLALCIFAVPEGIRLDSSGHYRPLLLGLYITAIPFYVALYQAIKLLDYIDQNDAFSHFSVGSLRIIKRCAVIIGTLFAASLPYVYFVADKSDASIALVVGSVVAFASFVIAVFAAVLQKLLKNAINIKAENDLTV